MPWDAATAGHAIERVSLTLLFGESLPAKVFSSVIGLIGHKAASAGPVDAFVLPTVQVQLTALSSPSGQNVPIQQVPGHAPGRAFRRTQGGRLQEEIVCNVDNVVFSATTYTGWNDFIAPVTDCLSEAVTRAAEVVSIVETRLEYWDRFDRKVPGPGEGDPLLNPGSKLIAPYFGKQATSWHAHCGFFLEDEPGLKTLVNANVDVITNGRGTPQAALAQGIEAQARIYTLAAAQATLPGPGFEDWNRVRKVAEQRHDLLKSVIGDIIHPELAARINLAAKPFQSESMQLANPDH